MSDAEYLQLASEAFASGFRVPAKDWAAWRPQQRLAFSRSLHAELLASAKPADIAFRKQNRRLFPPPPIEPTTSPAMPLHTLPQATASPADTKPRPVVVNCDLHGAGDAIVMAWIAEGARGTGNECGLHATGHKRELLEAFGQNIVESSEGCTNTFAAYTVETRIRGGESRVIQRGRFLGFHSDPKRPQAKLTPADRKLADLLQPGGMLLFPNVDDGTREWPPFYWLDLFERLDALGLRPSIITAIPDGRYSGVSSYFYGFRWPEIMAAMLECKAVIGNDSGPMHVAGTLDVTTFAMLGPTTSPIHVHMPSVTGLSCSKDDLDCVGCFYNPPFTQNCKYGCVALSHLTPDSVLSSILEKISGNHTA